MSVEIDLDYKDYYQEELYMTADVETGILYNRSGRRMLALTDDFLIGLHRALEKECGENATAIIHACGRKWGRNFGEGLTAEWSEFYGRSFRSFPMALFQSLLIQEFAHNGWGNLHLNYDYFDRGVIWLALEGAIMASIRKDAGNTKADILTAGILGGMYSYFLNRDVDCVQSQSEAEGFGDSRFVISSQTRIDQLRERIAADATHEQTMQCLLEIQESSDA